MANTFGDREENKASKASGEKREENKASKATTSGEKRTKKSAETSAEQLRREEVSAKVLAAKMCQNIFAASSVTVAAYVESQPASA